MLGETQKQRPRLRDRGTGRQRAGCADRALLKEYVSCTYGEYETPSDSGDVLHLVTGNDVAVPTELLKVGLGQEEHLVSNSSCLDILLYLLALTCCTGYLSTPMWAQLSTKDTVFLFPKVSAALSFLSTG